MSGSRATVQVVGVALVSLLAVACLDETPATGLDDVTLQPSHNAASGATRVLTADLRPLNGHVSFRPVTGKAKVKISGDRIDVSIHATGLEPGIPHPQHIHGFLGGGPGVCPTMDADDNGDGVVDVIEGLPDYGGILVTLDSDITDGAGLQVGGLPNPSNSAGAIQYRMSASLADVEAGLGGALEPGKRHIVLHGVNPETPLPEAASLGGFPAWLTLPVACGELEQVGHQ